MKPYRVKFWQQDEDGRVEYMEFDTMDQAQQFTTVWAGKQKSRNTLRKFTGMR